MPTRLYFAKDESIVVDEDMNAVEGAFRTAAPDPAPLAQFTMKDKKVLVNVMLVRYFQEYKGGKASFS
jgi:hypothetical protein